MLLLSFTRLSWSTRCRQIGLARQEPRPDEFFRAVEVKFHASRATPHVEVPFGCRLHPLPFQEYRLGAALAAHHAHGLSLHGLSFRVDAGSCAIAQAVADDLSEMPHEFVVALELIPLDSDDRSVIGDSDQ